MIMPIDATPPSLLLDFSPLLPHSIESEGESCSYGSGTSVVFVCGRAVMEPRPSYRPLHSTPRALRWFAVSGFSSSTFQALGARTPRARKRR